MMTYFEFHLHLIAGFVDMWLENGHILLFWQVKPVVHVFQVCSLTI